ncbi:60S ribosomal protein L35a-1 [Hordeum vulgare]|nr:60S ribosomal protein L35a-1 [Hordeum vulgare]
MGGMGLGAMGGMGGFGAMGGMGAPSATMGGMGGFGAPSNAMGGMGAPPAAMGGMGGFGAPSNVMGGMGAPPAVMGGMGGFGAPSNAMGGMGGMSFASLMGGMGAPPAMGGMSFNVPPTHTHEDAVEDLAKTVGATRDAMRDEIRPVHAEQFLIANAAAVGEPVLRVIAVSHMPCGHCRQFLSEIRGAAGIRILVTSDAADGCAAEWRTLASLLPRSFGPHDLLPKDAPRPRATQQPPRRSRQRRRQWLRRRGPRGALEGRRGGCSARAVQRRVRLYVRGAILGFKRSKSNQYESTSLLQVEGVITKEDVSYYAGKRIAYVYKAKTKSSCTTFRCIWGKVTRPHGNSGVVRAQFWSNLPATSMGSNCQNSEANDIATVEILIEILQSTLTVEMHRHGNEFHMEVSVVAALQEFQLVEVEYVPEKPDLGADNPLLLGALASVEKFSLTDHSATARVEVPVITNLGLMPRKVSKVVIVDGGLMGSGIATALILSHYPVILKEVDEKFLNAGIDRIKGSCRECEVEA